MPLMESAMLPIGTAAPEFSLPDVVTGKIVSLADFRGASALLVMFLCRHCPFVKHIEDGIASLARVYRDRGVAILAISSNDAEEYPEDAPLSLKEQAKECEFCFPYLYDETQDVARAFGAVCTPDFFLFDKTCRLAYRGRFDASRPGNGLPITGEDLRQAMDRLLAGRPPSDAQHPSVGCNIKWRRAGAAPL